MIKIIGLGPGDADALTIGALSALKSGVPIFLRTYKHPTVEYLKNQNIIFQTYDDKYETSSNFEEVYKSIADDLVKQHEEYKNIIYAVPGHPLVAESSVAILLRLCEQKNIEVEIISAVSFIDVIIERLKIDPVEGLKIIDSFGIENQILDKRVGTLITQVYNESIASDVKLSLLEYYEADTTIIFVRAAGVKNLESIREIPLFELDRQKDIDYLTSIYIPKDIDNSKDFNDLLKIMEKLRSENGCPWDKEQTHKSLKKYLIEECYEVLEAIDEKDEEKIVEELGDVLLQIVFHACIGKEDGYFNISDVIKSICKKMILRHPHVFGEVIVSGSKEVLYNWDAIKVKEKGYKTYTEQLKHVAKNLPSLMRASKVQGKAANIGFDIENIESAMDKILEELNEVKNVYKSNNRAKILEEVGDLIFSTVNVSRFLDIEPEFALNYTIDKFITRFEYIEETVTSKGDSLEGVSLQIIDQLWEESKKV